MKVRLQAALEGIWHDRASWSLLGVGRAAAEMRRLKFTRRSYCFTTVESFKEYFEGFFLPPRDADPSPCLLSLFAVSTMWTPVSTRRHRHHHHNVHCRSHYMCPALGPQGFVMLLIWGHIFLHLSPQRTIPVYCLTPTVHCVQFMNLPFSWSKMFFCPDWCGSVDWVPACEPKGCWFDSQSGYMPRL